MTPPSKTPFQFGLKSIFWLMAGVAVAAAVAMRFLSRSTIGRIEFVAGAVEWVIAPCLFLLVLFLMHRGPNR